VGTAFQLIDDVLDYSGDLGKNLGDDLAEGKPTLPLIYTMRCGSPRRPRWCARRWPRAGAAISAGAGGDPRLRRARLRARRGAARSGDRGARDQPAAASEFKQSLLELASFAVTAQVAQSPSGSPTVGA
jgi:octaprenyl-diphosphate synthase